MDTKKRSNAVVTVAVDGNLMAFTADGRTATLDLSKMHPDVMQRALVHGMKQRVSDAAAIPCDAKTGLPASRAEKFAAMEALVNHYNSGTADWNRARGEGGGGKQSNVLQAMANVYGFTLEKARETIEAFAAKRGIDYKKAVGIWRSSDKIVAELVRMAAAKPAAVDADDLMDELEG